MPVVEIYSNRLTITSYGGLVPGLSKDEFFAGRSMLRNREIMRVYRDLDLVEQLGSGIGRILQVYSKDIFNFSENFMEVSFSYESDYFSSEENLGYTSASSVLEADSQHHVGISVGEPSGKRRVSAAVPSGKLRVSLGETANKILDSCSANPSITIPELALKIGITERSIQRNIQKLQNEGFLKRAGGRKQGHWEVILD